MRQLIVEGRLHSKFHGDTWTIQDAETERVIAYFDGATAEYDAHLFAAAPELVETIKGLLDLMAQVNGYLADGSGQTGWVENCDSGEVAAAEALLKRIKEWEAKHDRV